MIIHRISNHFQKYCYKCIDVIQLLLPYKGTFRDLFEIVCLKQHQTTIFSGMYAVNCLLKIHWLLMSDMVLICSFISIFFGSIRLKHTLSFPHSVAFAPNPKSTEKGCACIIWNIKPFRKNTTQNWTVDLKSTEIISRYPYPSFSWIHF